MLEIDAASLRSPRFHIVVISNIGYKNLGSGNHAKPVKEERMVRIKPVRVMKRGHYFQLYFYNHLQKRRRISAGNNYLVAQKMAVRFTDWLIDGKDPEKEYRNLKVKDASLPMTLRESYSIFMKRHGNFKSKSMQISYDKSFRIICSKSNLADISLGRLYLAFFQIICIKD
ncbi:hypothetical protein IID62_03235 [candidate division KSB1 bacterium]|nr:hypothetical protein [candidate division KSB1 bacterium]